MDSFSKAYAKPSEMMEMMEVNITTIIKTNIALEVKRAVVDDIIFPMDDNTTYNPRNDTYDWIYEQGSHIKLFKKSYQGWYFTNWKTIVK